MYSTKGLKLELGWFQYRSSWRKVWKGKQHYFRQPDTEAGYLAAYIAWKRLVIEDAKQTIAAAQQDIAEAEAKLKKAR